MSLDGDAELVLLALGGDPRAFGDLVGRYQRAAHGLAYAIVGDWAEAEDLTQAAFLRAYLQLGQLREPARFAPWLRRVVTTTCLNWLQAHRPERHRAAVEIEELDLASDEPAPDAELERRETVQHLQVALGSLPARYRVPLVMFHLDGESYEGVAALLGRSVGTIKSLIHRGREKLRGPLAVLGREVPPGGLGEGFRMRITEIIEVARRGDAAGVARLLRQDRTLADAAGEHEKTPLHWAAENDQREIAELLLAAGANPELRTSWGATAFEWAATMGSKEVARLLLEGGAAGMNLWTAAALGMVDVVASYFAGGHPGPEAGRRRRPGEPPDEIPPDSALMTGDVVSDAFYIACRNGELAVARLLLHHGASIDAKGHFGATGLHWAAFNGHREVVQWLLGQGASTHLRDARFDATPSGWAAENDHPDLAKMIAEHR
jgi:RNA polymerase sigma-70 factor (ECF subfamily)